MAKRKKTESSPTKDLLTRIRERYKLMVEADEDNRRLALEDLKFTNIPGEQWDAVMKKERGDRPCYEFNKLRVTCKRVINDMRANRPAGKVRGVEDGDKDTAEIYEGLIRNIWNTSDGDTAIDHAAEYQVEGGMGAWRVITEYADDSAFDQDILIKGIPNPFCLYFDPSAKDPMHRDAQDCILTERISKAAYKRRWPNAEVVEWESTEFDDDEEWQDDETVRICEYWWKEPVQKELWQLEDGKVIDAASDEAALIPPETVKRKRSAICNQVKMVIASGEAILEGPTEWAGKHIPFVMVYGEKMVIDGKVYWWGLPRFGKDAQRSYNLSRTSIDETIAATPQAKFWATVEQAKGHVEKWAEAHKKNFPFLLYNPDGKASGPPERMGGADVPVALMNQAQIASEDIKAVTGIFDASLGQSAPEKSGRAIIARQQQGEIATFNYMDNLAKGIKRTWEILVDLIPQVYDTERELRILGSDGSEDYAKVNQVVQDPTTGQVIKVHDLGTGRYDVTITVGPSFATKRQEAAEMYTQLAQSDEGLMPSAGDLVYKSLDLPYAEEIAERRRALLPPQIQQILSQGKKIPPEAQAVMAQAQQAMQMVEQQSQLVQQAAQELQQEQMGVEKGKAEIQTALANLKAEQAQFNAEVAKQMAALTVKDAQLQVHDAKSQAAAIQSGAETEVKAKESEFSEAVQAIQQAAQEFMQAAAVALQAIQQQAAEQTAMHQQMTAQRPRIARMESQRVNGQLVAIPVYEDQVSPQ